MNKTSNQKNRMEIFNFNIHYIKVDEETMTENGLVVTMGFQRPISVLAESFEDAHTQALDLGQALLRELDYGWYMRLTD